MNIRIMGTEIECQFAAQALRDSEDLEVLEVSGWYRNRGETKLGRVYVEARQA